MTKVLPMGEPIINSYPGYGSGFSILEAYTQEHWPWVYNFFVQIFSPPNLNEGTRLNYVVPDIINVSPWLKTIYMDRGICMEMMDIVALIKTYINHDYYFYACFNVSEIAAYKREEKFYHESFIYGYNDEKEEFYFADNYDNGRYAHGVASYQEIKNATKTYLTSNYKDGFKGIKYIKENELKFFRFNKRVYIDLLIDYIEEKDSNRHWLTPGIVIKVYEGRKWGIGVYSYVMDYLNLIHETGKHLDQRGFYVIKEHKHILEKSLTYVLGEQWKKVHSIAGKLLEKDIQMATIVLNLCIKYNIVFDENILDKIKYYVAELEANERKLFPLLINILEEK